MAVQRPLILLFSPADETELAMLRKVSDDLHRAGARAARFLLGIVRTPKRRLAWRPTSATDGSEAPPSVPS